MAARTDTFDLGRLKLTPGEGRKLDLSVPVESFAFAGEQYGVEPYEVPVTLDVSRMVGQGYSLRLRFSAALSGPCMRCLEDLGRGVEIDAREVDQPGGGEELESPYVEDGTLDLHAWARDALVLALPAQLVCRVECRGLCALCGENLNEAPDHRHEAQPDPRWAALDALKLESRRPPHPYTARRDGRPQATPVPPPHDQAPLPAQDRAAGDVRVPQLRRAASRAPRLPLVRPLQGPRGRRARRALRRVVPVRRSARDRARRERSRRGARRRRRGRPRRR